MLKSHTYSADAICRFIFTIVLVGTMSLSSFAQTSLTGLASDYNGYWMATDTFGTVRPASAHNLLAIQSSGTWYSTGVDYATLTANGLSFVPTSYTALQPNTPLAKRVGQGSNDDGDTLTFSGPPIYATPSVGTSYNVFEYITDGVQGLNLSTFANNVGGVFSFFVASVNVASIGDAQGSS